MHLLTRRSFIAGAVAPLLCNHAQAAEPEALDFIAIGDWGAPPGSSSDDSMKRKWQAKVAKTATEYVQKEQITPAALLALGDNFYGKLSGVKDKRWQWGLEDLYPAKDWPGPIPFVLGNHDYEEPAGVPLKDKNFNHEIAYARLPGKRWTWGAHENETWYRRDFAAAGQPVVTFLMLDTNTDHLRAPDGAKWKAQMQWVDQQMQAPDLAPWVIPVAHQPMWSAGYHYDEGDYRDPRDKHMYPILRKDLLPLLKTCPFYISGHDHSLQHVTHPGSPGMDFLISGGAGGDFPQSRHKKAAPDKIGFTSDFFEGCFGFLHLRVSRKECTWKLVGFHKKTSSTVKVFKSGTRSLGA